MKLAVPTLPIARPLYTGPVAPPSTTVMEELRLTAGDQPDTPTKMKAAAPVTAFCVTLKSCVPLKTMPVGWASPAAPAGMATTRDCGTPLPSYKVEKLLPLSLTQKKPVGLKATPQALTRWESVCGAVMVPSETRVLVANLLAALTGMVGTGA